MVTEVVIYACQQAVPNPDFLRTQWGQDNIRLQVLPEPCSSKIEAFQLLRTLAAPADLVWVIGCAEDLCRYNEGSHRLGNRIAYTQRYLEEIGLESARVGRSVVVPGDAQSLAAAVAEIGQGRGHGVSPLKSKAQAKCEKVKLVLPFPFPFSLFLLRYTVVLGGHSAKYHIPGVPPLLAPAKTTIIDWNEGCLRCERCVKQICPVDAYKKRDFDRRQFVDTIDEMCRSCYRCVQGCPRELVFKALNPQYRRLGDDYYTPEIIGTTWYQAETGKIPVSGAGYGRVFAGEGFDSLWTDMSEIVSPTRDGIHEPGIHQHFHRPGPQAHVPVFDEQRNCFSSRPADGTAPAVVMAEPMVRADPQRLRQILARSPDPEDRGDPGTNYRTRVAGLAASLVPLCPPLISTWMIRSWLTCAPWSLPTAKSSNRWRPLRPVVPSDRVD
jgi:coenzyme F420-reducing hydrogenase delta subunit/NAD-dependent dihydropyrimidine dehydrogenase PreA subunit